MSRDPNDSVNPQPGAMLGDYESNGLAPEDVKADDSLFPGWPVLPGAHAVNFADDRSLKPVLIDVGSQSQGLFRVWGEPAWDIGRYWTGEAPKSEEDFYGRTAVAFSWNTGLYLAKMITGGKITQIQGWKGTVAKQPAEGRDRGEPVCLLHYYLPGGAIQYFVPDGSLPYISEQHTSWNPPAQSHEVIPRPDLKVGLPAKGVQADGSHYEALASMVDYLARLLAAAGRQGTALGVRNSSLTGQAAILAAKASQLRAHAENLPDVTAKAHLIAQSLVPIARYLDGQLQWSNYRREIDVAIHDVVRWAYAIGVQAA